MKGRPKTIRKISFIPAVSGFRPYGDNVNKSNKACVFLFYEEYEALRLNDYEKHSQCESAEIMQVSRPTFTRIYMSAREKIAKAFVEGLRIVVEGGKVELDGNWYVCQKCKAIFSTANGESLICALCGSSDVQPWALPESVSSENEYRLSGKKMEKANVAYSPLVKQYGRGCHRGRCRRQGGEVDKAESDIE